jgi:hypothetical protein
MSCRVATFTWLQRLLKSKLGIATAEHIGIHVAAARVSEVPETNASSQAIGYAPDMSKLPPSLDG